jgi:hypothetical protein
MKNPTIFALLIIVLIFSENSFSQVVQRKNSSAISATSQPKNNSQNTVQPRNNTQKREAYVSKPVKERSNSGGYGGFHQGDKMLNVGLGLSSYYYGTPIGLSFESGINDNVSIGVQLDYNSGSYNDYYNAGYYGGYYYSSRYNYSWGYTAYYLGARGSYHLNEALKIRDKNIDLYVGLGLGYQSFKWKDSSYGYGTSYDSGIFFNYFVGGKYFFNDKLGAFVELGYTGLSSSRVGLAVKF